MKGQWDIFMMSQSDLNAIWTISEKHMLGMESLKINIKYLWSNKSIIQMVSEVQVSLWSICQVPTGVGNAALWPWHWSPPTQDRSTAINKQWILRSTDIKAVSDKGSRLFYLYPFWRRFITNRTNDVHPFQKALCYLERNDEHPPNTHTQTPTHIWYHQSSHDSVSLMAAILPHPLTAPADWITALSHLLGLSTYYINVDPGQPPMPLMPANCAHSGGWLLLHECKAQISWEERK